MKFKYIVLLAVIIGCESMDTISLSTEICNCFESQEKQFSESDDEGKFGIVKNCFSDKINNKAIQLNNEYIENSDRSKLIDFTHEVAIKASTLLSMNCNFYKNNQDEIRRLIGIKANYREKKPTGNNPKKSLYISGQIVDIENLEYNSSNIFLTDNQGNKMKFFYKL